MAYTFTGDPVVGGARRVVFISADDDGAKKEVETLLTGFGYSVIDLGNFAMVGLFSKQVALCRREFV